MLSRRHLPFCTYVSHRPTNKQYLSIFQVAVTQHSDYEQSSSSPYNSVDPFDPVVNFQSYIDDNENIVDEV